MRSALVVLMVLVGCKPKQAAPASTNGSCLQLPFADRTMLRAGPDGKSLYWFERVHRRDYDGDDVSVHALVRYDVETRKTTAIHQPAWGPLHFASDGRPLFLSRRGNSVELVSVQGGLVQTLVPGYFDVKDVEPIERDRFAVSAVADGKWSVFTLDLDSPRPQHLVDADVLLSAIRGRVFVRDDDGSYAVDLATGDKTPLALPAKVVPERELVYFVEDQQVKVRSLAAGTVETIVAEKRDWKLHHQPGSVLAHARVGKVQHAFLLARGKATPLPEVRGETAIVGTAAIGTNLAALVAHNTSNDEDDVWQTTHEADVCILEPKQKVLVHETRELPARYVAKAQPFWAAANALPKTRWQILDNLGEVTTVHVNIDEPGGEDLAKQRARARELHRSVTRLLGDDELRTRIDWEDGRTATYRWRRERLRGLAMAGFGDLQLADPNDYDVELADWSVTKIDDDTHVKCVGKVTNLRGVIVEDLEVRCIAGDRERAVRIPKLEPKQTHAFAQTFEAKPDDELVLEVYRGRNLQVLLDRDVERADERAYQIFLELHRDTKLALRSHALTARRFYVELEPPKGTKVADVERALAAVASRMEDARAQLGVPKDIALELEVYAGNKFYEWNGTALVLDE